MPLNSRPAAETNTMGATAVVRGVLSMAGCRAQEMVVPKEESPGRVRYGRLYPAHPQNCYGVFPMNWLRVLQIDLPCCHIERIHYRTLFLSHSAMNIGEVDSSHTPPRSIYHNL